MEARDATFTADPFILQDITGAGDAVPDPTPDGDSEVDINYYRNIDNVIYNSVSEETCANGNRIETCDSCYYRGYGEWDNIEIPYTKVNLPTEWLLKGRFGKNGKRHLIMLGVIKFLHEKNLF
ncbi:hypothetical protein TVAG_448760 [Trichomonas vaginalis G3]|uniref:Uncharacterized protein n=1 Tax=Trichomonas vaginalis (strain ATCC PRA-98 / G3) TaxID=412133 RepID=A2FZ31_TRIV3|nr:hypothetical protein TVAGG3_0750880 [Trichomonas vaginalis G3]EAX89845.1 hypothetical protein TVAG_448760 [Trichomonas vaginalis G3]KAI5512540.1 hypothetical protein TVAGG3_0750880 [Trichomonas vaginalis G3]|eukprot:XP_001302775.1 hypothetical protein [Trichomonas vaginalis G3]